MTLARTLLAQWRAADPLSNPQAITAGRLHLLDALGVGLAASTLDQGEPYARLAAKLAPGPAILLTNGQSSSASDAALINGGLIHSLEFDDTHTASIVHGSAVLLPAALAAAQMSGASSTAMVSAYIKGWEALIRIGLAAQGGFQRRGFQITSVGGALIAALIAADLMKADDDQAVAAMGIALSQASGVFEFLSNGSSVKSMHPGWAAHAGLWAAQLALAGIGGPETSLEGKRGLFAAFTDTPEAAERLQAALNDFGTQWHIHDAAFKFVPSCHYLHPFVEGAKRLMEQGIQADQIDHIVLRIAEGAAPIVCDPWDLKLNPRDGHAARWSLPIVVAEQWIHGRVDLESFTRPADTATRALAARMRWEKLEPHHFPQAFEAELDVTLKNGAHHSIHIDDVFGNASRPAREESILQKFRSNAKRALKPVAVDDLVAWGFSLEHGAPLDALSKILTRRLA